MARNEYRDGQRHGWIDNLCRRLERVIWGQEAEKLLTDPDSLPVSGAVVRLTAWHWARPGIDVGRKARTSDGTVLLPLRVSRPAGHLAVVASGDTREHQWSATGMGLKHQGTIEVTCTPMALGTEPVEDTAVTAVAAPAIPRADLITQLKTLAAEGHQARWDVILGLEPYVRAAVRTAHGYVCAELAGPEGDSRPVLDHQGLEAISDTLLLGDHDPSRATRPSAVARLVDRCLADATFRRVDPQKYIRRSLRRDAEQQIRIQVGDPRIGPKIRAVARELGSTDLEEIIAVYRERYPDDELGSARAVAALATPGLFTGPAAHDRALAHRLGLAQEHRDRP